ncbi:MAG: RES domain-containing protein [Candidatus Kapabacteria bacterium]|nr:RES domain-containing protein [Candidatus Kapabacteria bacterium]
MTCWRLVKERRAENVLSGDGSRLFGGGWNHPGQSIVYASSSLSLAALEVFVHLHGHEVNLRFRAFQLSMPDNAVEVITTEDLPDGWRSSPSTDECKAIGSAWALSQRSLALAVPSIIVPQETNILLSTNHPLFKRVRITSEHAFAFDERMF